MVRLCRSKGCNGILTQAHLRAAAPGSCVGGGRRIAGRLVSKRRISRYPRVTTDAHRGQTAREASKKTLARHSASQLYLKLLTGGHGTINAFPRAFVVLVSTLVRLTTS